MLQICSLESKPEALDDLARLYDAVWSPRFPPSKSTHLVPRLVKDFSEFVLLAYDSPNENLLAYAAAIPFKGPEDLMELPDTGYDGVLEAGIHCLENRIAPNMLSALAIAVAPEHRGHNLSETMVRALLGLANRHDFSNLVVPLRPTKKADEPFTDMEQYIQRRREDGKPADPWLRLHLRLGARIIKICHKSMTMRNTIDAWEAATGIKFPVSGQYAIPRALSPLEVDLEQNTAVLVEPNVWMHYRI